MAKKRVTRKQLLKEPDEFITFTGRMIQFARTYKNYILYGTSALLILFLIISGVKFYVDWKEKKAFAALEEVLAQYDNNPSANSDMTAVKTEFKKIVEKYAGYSGGKMARVIFANICYASGEFDAAVAHYTTALNEFTDHPSMRPLLQSSLGYAYQAKKDFRAAADQFEKIVADPEAVLKDEALFNLGQIYAQLGNAAKSREAFQKILSDHADSIYVEMVRERLAG